MGLYKGPSCKLCRREGVKLFLKSDRCDSPKCALARRAYVPGQHGPTHRSKLSEYGIRLREKQKLKRFYYISESQLSKYFNTANRMHGDTVEELLQLIERRLDNVVYRLGIVDTRRQARLFVKHGHYRVNGKKVDIPSYLVKEGDVISIAESSLASFEGLLAKAKKVNRPSWFITDDNASKYTFNRIPLRDEIEIPINMQFIVEFYSR